MRRSVFETMIGALVLVVAGVFLYYAYQNSAVGQRTGYPLTATFLSVGGLGNGADVRIGGVKVGSVVALELDQTDYVAVVTLSIEDEIAVPIDTAVVIASEGLLGGAYVSLEPGGDGRMAQSGDELVNTHDVASVEDLLGRAIFLITEGGGEDNSGTGSPAGTGLD